MASQVSFITELQRLLGTLRDAAAGHPKLERGVTLYQKAFDGSLDQDKHLTFFEPLWAAVKAVVLTELQTGTWLEQGEYEVAFMESTKARLFLSKLYILTKERLPRLAPMDPATLHPDIILLHLYRIFDIIEPLDRLKQKVKVLEQKLRRQPSDGLAGMIGPVVTTFESIFGPLGDQGNAIVNTVKQLASTPEVTGTVNNFTDLMTSFAATAATMAPKVQELFSEIQTQKITPSDALNKMLADPTVQGQLDKLEQFKPTLVQGAQLLKQHTGIDMPEISESKSVKDMINESIQSADAQQELSQFNGGIQTFLKDGTSMSSLAQNGVNFLRNTGVTIPGVDLDVASAALAQHSAQATDVASLPTLAQLAELADLTGPGYAAAPSTAAPPPLPPLPVLPQFGNLKLHAEDASF